MLEIILIVVFTKRIGRIIRDKGRRAGWYQLLFVLLWFGGEFAGGIVGGIVGLVIYGDKEPNMLIIYPAALAGAVAGAVLGFVIAKSVRPVDDWLDDDSEEYPRRRPQRRLPADDEGEGPRSADPDTRFEADR